MKGVAKYEFGKGNVKLMDFPDPKPGPGEVKIEVKEAGICGSDIHIWDAEMKIPMQPPVILGHEFAAVVVGLGEGVDAWKVGDRVVGTLGKGYCGICDYCKDGYLAHCTANKAYGYWYHGSFAKYMVMPSENLLRIPDTVSDTAAALTEPLACCVNAVCMDVVNVRATDFCLVTGPGAMGLLAAQVAKAQGAKVILSGVTADEHRLQLAKDELGIDVVVNSQKEDLKQVVMDLTNGYGCEIVVECSGAEAAINQAVWLTRPHGRYSQVGLPGKKISIDIEVLIYKDMIMVGNYASRQQDYRMALKLMEAGMVKAEPLVSHKLPLSDWEKGFNMFASKEGVKVVLVPEE